MAPPDGMIARDFEIVVVRSTKDVDCRELARLEILAWGRQPSAIETEKRTARIEAEVTAIHPRRKGFLVARKAGRLVGCCRVVEDRNAPAQWWLVGLAVHADHRRRGVGRALVLEGIACARAHGAAVFRSETHADNQVSIRFHERLGFRNEGRFTAPDGDEKIAFSLNLV